MGKRPPSAAPTLLIAIALLAGAGLGVEVLLMRLLSIIQWHHFAYMLVSVALLGFGASGSFLTLARDRLAGRFDDIFVLNCALFGITAFGCFLLAQQVPFNGLELIWEPSQFLDLLLLYLLLFLPFFFAANSIGLALMTFGSEIHRIYSADLVGAALGALGVMGLMFVVEPVIALRIIAGAGLLAGLVIAWQARRGIRITTFALLALGAVFVLIWPPLWSGLHISEYKGLPKTLNIHGTEVIETRSSPLGLLHVVESPKVPFRHAPGLSLNSSREPPPQLAVFTDGGSLSVITRYSGETERLDYLRQTSSALPYALIQQPEVLVLGAGGGSDVLQALAHDAAYITAVEINPQMVELVRETYARYAGGIYSQPRVDMRIASARGFLADHGRHYDIIQVSMLDSFVGASAGTQALSENHIYTVEALQAYFHQLKDEGLISITRWLKLPPRDSLRLFSTAIKALKIEGIDTPGNHLAMIRSWQAATLLISNQPFTEQDVQVIKRFCDRLSFDVAWYPGITEKEVNQFNLLEQPWLYEGAKNLLGPSPETYLENYKFDIQPTTDDRPYFFHFFKWRVLPELLSLREQGGLILLDSGYLILVGTLVQALPVALILILLPLVALKKEHKTTIGKWRPAVYFACLGLGFLFVEIACIQRFVLFLGHPLYAIATVLTGFLLFAGIGSGLASRFGRFCPQTPGALVLASIAVAILILLYSAGLEPVLNLGIDWPTPLKVIATLLLLAPLAGMMGMPFPLGMAKLDEQAPAFVPWAWGINGCASVLSAILAMLMAVHLGFTAVLSGAAALYLMAGTIWQAKNPGKAI